MTLGADYLMIPRVAIVVLNWNNAPDTLQCLALVLAPKYTNCHVIIEELIGAYTRLSG